MNELCRRDMCSRCIFRNNPCEGCRETDGHPCGGSCTAAECVKKNGFESLMDFSQTLCAEINALGLDDLNVSSLNLLTGSYVNLSYPLPNGKTVDFLDNSRVYFGTQIEREGSERCLGVVCDDKFILVCEYGECGSDPEILIYKKR